MSDVYSDTYWTDEFDITIADLDRIATHIRDTGQAHDLTALARRVVRGRLRYGPETSAPAQPAWMEDPSVRLWDAAGKWKKGDHAIIAVWDEKLRRHVPWVGEVTKVQTDKVILATERGWTRTPAFKRVGAGSPGAQKGREFVARLIQAGQKSDDVDQRVEAVILGYGPIVVSRLLNALQSDECFVLLAGRWFLHELAVFPTKEQLAALAWAMALLDEPKPTGDLVPMVEPPLVDGDPGLFGLYLAIRGHSDLFENADPGQRPRWVLTGLPPGSCTPQYAAYDPETYEVLCLPGESAPPETVKRLWDLGLLKAVL